MKRRKTLADENREFYEELKNDKTIIKSNPNEMIEDIFENFNSDYEENSEIQNEENDLYLEKLKIEIIGNNTFITSEYDFFKIEINQIGELLNYEINHQKINEAEKKLNSKEIDSEEFTDFFLANSINYKGKKYMIVGEKVEIYIDFEFE
ncbi:hypothetical protein G6N05_15150 [Flavobacterium sp. F372]|uniref:Uncharacterized protein n=1 Tax=Flavobacterium bernardetii TaxID=2813823 RepID=A0ABR7J2R6_9FLAO|nr:hypothetical protein [Flavobacterium bernardetii]MBC5836223.1 hypothetical protein [Flavobacterium bernardetii]NHF71449.1 hypothetical protein [Flavobacterium bernardetii]